ncbi:hypothetical protein [Jiella sonneratiae]|uniref:Helix-turn-helix domain-containing protein n=1 Tax=Jiella sonneratiae TaxID=2816856 RepID=A0ABS3J327_9HYPH|nr:hypothetical protein [Jiella sonneratiae]MBO0904064.1 hypothetical protein [Jiella sonneratiae]
MADESPQHWPRFMTDRELRAWLGLSERALKRYRELKDFPQKDVLAGKTDSVAVARFFDWIAGIAETPPRPNARYLPASPSASAKERR